jgi:hypothetical protein
MVCNSVSTKSNGVDRLFTVDGQDTGVLQVLVLVHLSVDLAPQTSFLGILLLVLAFHLIIFLVILLVFIIFIFVLSESLRRVDQRLGLLGSFLLSQTSPLLFLLSG